MRSLQSAWPQARAGINQVADAIEQGHPDPIPGKVTSEEVASLAARVLDGYKPTRAEILSMAGSCLAQNEKA
jgi:hypothetical protein